MLYDVLSLWELAHRWHEVDPNLTDPTALPLPVQDTLRFLTRSMARHELRSCSAKGVENKTLEDIVDFKDYSPYGARIVTLEETDDDTVVEVEEPDESEDGDPPEESELSFDEICDRYETYQRSQTRRHDQAIDGFEDCFERRIYDKDKLDTVYVSQWSLKAFCQDKRVPLPKFWYPGNDADPRTDSEAPARLTNNQIDKQLCQAVAQTLWELDPTLTIAAITRHKAIQRFANGAQYQEKTLRDWVKRLDPRPEHQRRGRPKKSTD